MYIFYVTATLRIDRFRRNLKGSNTRCSVEAILVSYWRIEWDAFFRVHGIPVCVCRSSENRKRTKCQMYIFNMVVLSVNPTSERDFWLPQKNISGGRLSKELTIRYYYNNKVEGSTVWVDPNRSNSLWTSENTSRHSNKSRVLHTWYVRLGGYIWARGGPPISH